MPHSLSVATRDSAPLPAALGTLIDARVRSPATLLVAARGETVKRAGGDVLLLALRGATKLVAHVSGGREQIVGFHFPEDIFYIPARPANDYTLCALTDCELLAWPARDVLALAEGEAGFAGELMRHMIIALERSREKSILLGRKTAPERIASFLVAMAERIGSRTGDRRDLVLPMSRRDIADSLGLTIETVSRQVTELRELGLIETSGRSTVKLLDLKGLRLRAGYGLSR